MSADCCWTSTKRTFCHFSMICFDFWKKSELKFACLFCHSTARNDNTSKFKLEKLQTVVKGVLIPKFTQILKGRGETIRAG